MPYTITLEDLQAIEQADFDNHVKFLMQPAQPVAPTPSDLLTNPLRVDPVAGPETPPPSTPSFPETPPPGTDSSSVAPAAAPPPQTVGSGLDVVQQPSTFNPSSPVLNLDQPAPVAPNAPVATPSSSGGVQRGDFTVNEFNAGLSANEAAYVCGPTAAYAFVRAYGRQPTLREAINLAYQNGLTTAGMGGPQNEVKLLKGMGVDAEDLGQAPDWGHVAALAQNGVPVIFSTGGHYYVANDYDPNTGKFFVGESGMVYRTGSAKGALNNRWMSIDTISKQGDGINGVIVGKGATVGSITVPQPNGQTVPVQVDRSSSVAPAAASSHPFQDDFTNHVRDLTGGTIDLGQVGNAVGSATQAVGQGITTLGSGLASTAQNAADELDQHVQGLLGKPATLQNNPEPQSAFLPMTPSMQPTPSDSLTNPMIEQNPTTPAVTPAPSPEPYKSPWDRLGEGMSSLFKNVFGGGDPSGPGGEEIRLQDNPLLGPVARRVNQRMNQPGGLNPGDVLQAEGDVAKSIGGAIYDASPGLQAAARQTEPGIGAAFAPAQDNANMIDSAWWRHALEQAGARHPITEGPQVPAHESAARDIAAMGVQSYLGAAGGALAARGNPLAFVIDPQGQLFPLGGVPRAGRPAAEVTGARGALGESAQLPVEAGLMRNEGQRIAPQPFFDARTSRFPALPAPERPATPMPGAAPVLDRVQVETGPRIGMGVPEGPPAPAPPTPVYDQYGVLVGHVPESAKQYDEFGVLIPPKAQDVVPVGATVPEASRLIPNANRARATAADAGAAQEGQPTRAARLSANDIYRRGEPPVALDQAFTRTPEGDIVPIEEMSSTDVLQAMIGEAEKKGVPQATIASMRSALQDLLTAKQSGEAQAGFAATGGVGQAARAVGGAVRAAPNPASAAPPMVQDALNTFDSTVRVMQSQTQRQVILGQMTQDDAFQAVKNVRGQAIKQFLNDVRNARQYDAQGDPVGVIERSTTDPTTGMWASTVKSKGWVSGSTLAPQLEDVWVSPEVATVVRNTLNHDITVPGLAGLARVAGQIKQLQLTGSPFHFIQEELQAIRLGAAAGDIPGTGQMVGRSTINAANPAAFRRWLTDPRIAPIADRLARAGGTLGTNEGEAIDLIRGARGIAIRSAVGGGGAAFGTYGVQKARGVPEEQARRDAAVAGLLGAVAAGPIGAVVGPAIFERQLPTLKIIGFKVLTDSGFPDQDAAQMVNNTFGGQNLTRMARDANFQAILRSAILAPDWWESWARNVGGAIPGMPVSREAGDMARKYVATTVVSAAVALEGFNYLLTGHFTTDNAKGHELDLEVPADRVPGAPASAAGDLVHVDILGPLRPMAQLVISKGDIGAFAKSRLSPPASLAVSALQNRNPATGGPLVEPGSSNVEAAGQIGAYELGQLNPAGSSGLTRAVQAAGPLAGGVAGATGMRVTATPGEPVVKPVKQEIDRLDNMGYSVGLPYPDKTFISGSSQITLSSDERQHLAALRGGLVNQRLLPLVSAPGWSKMPDDQKANQVALAVERAMTQAKQQFMNELPAKERAARLAAGQQVRGKLLADQPALQLPSFTAPSLPGR